MTPHDPTTVSLSATQLQLFAALGCGESVLHLADQLGLTDAETADLLEQARDAIGVTTNTAAILVLQHYRLINTDQQPAQSP